MHEKDRSKLTKLIAEKAHLQDLELSPSEVETLATVGTGYLVGATRPLPILGRRPLPPNAHDDLASELVWRYKDGVHPLPPEPTGYMKDYRIGIDALLNSRRDLPRDEAVRHALATLAAGFWDETMLDSTRSLYGSHVARYYLDGRG